MTRAPAGVSYSGVGVALLAFLVTRLLVASTLEPDAVSFMVAGMVPLLAGLGLTLYGVALAVGAFPQQYARTVWTGTVLGTLATLLVLGTTAVHSVLVGRGMEPLVDAGALVGNVVLGGAIAGAYVGDFAARGRQRRNELARYAERAMLVNRLLRHEVTNATTIVKGYADQLGRDDVTDPAAAIRDSAGDIEERVSEIGEFAATEPDLRPIAVQTVLETVAEEVGEAAGREDAVATSLSVPEDVRVLADQRLSLLVRELVENAVEHAGEHPGDDVAVELAAEATPETVTLTVRDDGTGLPEAARSVLETPGLPETDDPRYGYGLQMVRLLVDHYGGGVSVDDADGTAVAVTLQRPPEDRSVGAALGVPTDDLYRAGVAGVLAGLVLGGLLELVAGAVPSIGRLYGVESAVVGWITHLFHSALFGLLFAAVVHTRAVRDRVTTTAHRVAAGAAWGVLVWVVAAELVVPLWLLAVNADLQFPALEPVGFLPHLVWGALLGWLAGALEGSPRLAAAIDRLPDGDQ